MADHYDTAYMADTFYPSEVIVREMIAHNRDSDLDIFQIAPGKTAESRKLAHEERLAVSYDQFT
jgi:hypothetical protein